MKTFNNEWERQEYEEIVSFVKNCYVEMMIGNKNVGILYPFKDYSDEQIDEFLDEINVETEDDPADYWKNK